MVRTFSSQRIREIAAEISSGTAISREQAYLLINTPEEKLTFELMGAANHLRNRSKGSCISFSKKVFIPLTNICRDYCLYCVYRKDPGEPGAKIMSPDEVLAVARAGALVGCKEALFSLGDRPELAFPSVREELNKLGHKTMLGYLREVCRRVLLETGLLPHCNPGLMGSADLANLKPYNASLGLMLENLSDRLMSRGGAHEFAPDKRPRLRLKTIQEAGKQRIPFTTGILIGIGETPSERVDSLFAIRDLHLRYGHIQEVIIQNFRAKKGTPMCNHQEPGLLDLARTAAIARLIFGGRVNIQVPPNLSPSEYQYLLSAGINDWGGVSPLTPDYINPEAPWPHLEELRRMTEKEGLILRERLAVYPEFIEREGFLSPEVLWRVKSMCDENGYARCEKL